MCVLNLKYNIRFQSLVVVFMVGNLKLLSVLGATVTDRTDRTQHSCVEHPQTGRTVLDRVSVLGNRGKSRRRGLKLVSVVEWKGYMGAEWQCG